MPGPEPAWRSIVGRRIGETYFICVEELQMGPVVLERGAIFI